MNKLNQFISIFVLRVPYKIEVICLSCEYFYDSKFSYSIYRFQCEKVARVK